MLIYELKDYLKVTTILKLAFNKKTTLQIEVKRDIANWSYTHRAQSHCSTLFYPSFTHGN